MEKKPESIPSGLDHITMISRINQSNRKQSEGLLRKHVNDLRILGTAVSAIYQAATCYRKCWATGHILELIGARIYNLACGAYSLISIGYYDEALNLIRGVGEAGNLVVLSVKDKNKFGEWLRASKRERLNNFSPKKVRGMIGLSDALLVMDDDTYSDLSETYTHPTPNMLPNLHKEMNRAVAGGIVQERGAQTALQQLRYVVAMIALLYCKYFEFDDLFAELSQLAQEVNFGDKRTSGGPMVSEKRSGVD